MLGLANTVRTNRLAACGQNIAPIRSIYRWDGDIHDEQEARVALHTRTELVPKIVERTIREHDYDVPCVIALPMIACNPAYAAWIIAETEPRSPEERRVK